VQALADEYQVEMPIVREVYGTIEGTRTPEMAFRGLIRRPVGAEWQPDR
jgi:glycerol-3-phosphate dehydrogenase